MEVVEEGIVAPQVGGDDLVAIGEDALDLAHGGADQAHVHVVPVTHVICGLLVDGGELHVVHGEVLVDEVMRASHVGHEGREVLGVHAGVGLEEIALALIPDQTRDGVSLEGIHVVVVEEAAAVGVNARGDVVALGGVVAVGALLGSHLVAHEGTDGTAVTVDLNQTNRHLAVGELHVIVGEEVADGGEVVNVGVAIGLLPFGAGTDLQAHLVGTLLGVAGGLVLGVVVDADGGVVVQYVLTALIVGVHVLMVVGHGVGAVGLTHDHVHVAHQHVLELVGHAVGVDLHGVAQLSGGLQTGGEGDLPRAVFNDGLGEHTLELARDLLAVLGGIGPAPDTEELPSLHHHIGGEDVGDGELGGVGSVEGITHGNVHDGRLGLLGLGGSLGRSLGGLGLGGGFGGSLGVGLGVGLGGSGGVGYGGVGRGVSAGAGREAKTEKEQDGQQKQSDAGGFHGCSPFFLESSQCPANGTEQTLIVDR